MTIAMLVSRGCSLSTYCVLGTALNTTTNPTYSLSPSPFHKWEMKHREVKELPKVTQLVRNGVIC